MSWLKKISELNNETLLWTGILIKKLCTISTRHRNCTISTRHRNCTIWMRHRNCILSTRHRNCAISMRHKNCTISMRYQNCTISMRHRNCTISTRHQNCTKSTWHRNCTISTLGHIALSNRTNLWEAWKFHLLHILSTAPNEHHKISCLKNKRGIERSNFFFAAEI